MALNIFLENTIKSRKVEQAQIHESRQLCAEITDVMTSQTRLQLSVESETKPPADSSPVDKEEIDLLEKALEKALQVRSGSKDSVPRTNTGRPFGSQHGQDASTEGASSSYKGLTKSKLLSKTTDRKDTKKYQTKKADGLKSARTNDPKIKHGKMISNRVKAVPDLGQHTLPSVSNIRKMKSAQLCGRNVNAISDSSSTSSVSVSKLVESNRDCRFQHDDTLKWTKLKRKENRLWDKILAFENKPLPGRALFMERMRGTFPMKWPNGSPEKIQVLVHRLNEQAQGLPENRLTDGVRTGQTTGETKARSGDEGSQDSGFKFDKHELSDIHKCAFQLKREWESWDRWRPQWGCLCSIGTESEWYEGRPAPLPKTISYSTERELTELETLRMRVALLQQETFVEKILSDTLSPLLSSSVCATLNPSLLRDLYSVLGEGGERFPAIVLDSEPDS